MSEFKVGDEVCFIPGACRDYVSFSDFNPLQMEGVKYIVKEVDDEDGDIILGCGGHFWAAHYFIHWSDATPAQRRGLVAGDKIILERNSAFFKKGGTIALVEDDGSINPFFKRLTGDTEAQPLNILDRRDFTRLFGDEPEIEQPKETDVEIELSEREQAYQKKVAAELDAELAAKAQADQRLAEQSEYLGRSLSLLLIPPNGRY